LAFAIGRGVDLAVLHGKDALRHSALVGIDTNNVIANTTNYKNLLDGAVYDGIVDGYDLVSQNTNFEFSGFAVDPRFRSTLARESVFKDANGNTDAARVNLASRSGDILGLPAQFGRAVGGDIDGNVDTGVRLIGGDWSQLRWGFADQIRVKITDTASISATDGGAAVSMWQTNQVAILVECTFGWVLGDKQGFVKYAKTGVKSYTVGTNGSTGGTFTLTLGGKTTAAIAEDATAATVKAAIVLLDDGYTTANVTVTGSAGGDWTVTVPDTLSGSGASLTGGTPSAALTVTPV
jgi:hypothetical protein